VPLFLNSNNIKRPLKCANPRSLNSKNNSKPCSNTSGKLHLLAFSKRKPARQSNSPATYKNSPKPCW
jgi:hypothetical protein